MSLINDALKRAKEAQQSGSALPAANPHLRPIESTSPEHPALGLIVPGALAVIALLLLLFVWLWARLGHGPKITEVRAQTTETRTFQPGTSSLPTDTAPGSSTGTSVIPQSASAKSKRAEPLPAPPPAPSLDNGTNVNAETNTSIQVEKPAPLRLQGIVFTPNRSSAVINGKTLFMGDRIREFHVVAIKPDSVTLAAGTKRQVLTLEE